MLLWLLEQLSGKGEAGAVRFAGYITVRSAAALVLAFVLGVLLGPRVIGWLRQRKIGQHIRQVTGKDSVDLYEMHAGKAGTPTMGGVLMVIAVMTAIILFGDWREPVLQLAVAMMLGFGAIGFVDDYRKLTGQNSKGLSSRGKLLWQGLLGISFGAIWLWCFPDLTRYAFAESTGPDMIVLPFFKEAAVSLGVLYLLFAAFVLTATSNAVNLTDGLDGLASGVSAVSALCFAVIAYLAGRYDMADYLIIPHVRGAGELTVLLAAMVGACFGFLWWNSHPASVFMGDTGSMMIGGLLGASALLVKQEFLLVIVGGVFVAEAMSVILQVGSMKLRHKRIFLMSPLHHHFERAGVPESKIIVRFWLVSALLALAGLSTLKLR